MPTSSEIASKVKSEISDIANMPESDVRIEFVLKDSPLRMDPTGLANLALVLRTFVKDNSKNTVSVTEIRKSGLTVSGLIELIDKKINGNENE